MNINSCLSKRDRNLCTIGIIHVKKCFDNAAEANTIIPALIPSTTKDGNIFISSLSNTRTKIWSANVMNTPIKNENINKPIISPSCVQNNKVNNYEDYSND